MGQYPRQNPFDRPANVDVSLENHDESGPTIWAKVKWYILFSPTIEPSMTFRFYSFFRRSPDANMDLNRQQTDEEYGAQRHHSHQINSSLNVTVAVVSQIPRSTSSNNILNSNLSGSFRGRMCDEDDEDDSDDVQPIFATMATTSAQRVNSIGGEPANTGEASSSLAASSSHSRIGVAALPNISFSDRNRRHSISSDGSGAGGGGGGRHLGRPPAASNDFFL